MSVIYKLLIKNDLIIKTIFFITEILHIDPASFRRLQFNRSR